ncbi:MAG: membrane dipeptidase [Oscillospiraceae bacterium]|nr:membrane dipeptidase [Oscillospiraceae bacterium]
MKLFDLHCDTIFRAIKENKDINNGDLCVNFEKIKKFEEYIGCFAIWIPDSIRKDDAFNLFNELIDRLNLEINKHLKFCKNIKIIISVEGGAVLGGDLSKIKILKSKGVKILTLTWNGKCEIGDGIGVKNSKGLTDFGIQVIKELEKNNIIIDLSHASKKLFYDVCELATKPFIATHSNSKSVCLHKRNLLDDQFMLIKQKNGIVGINFCNDFLSNSGNANIEDVFEHIEKFLSFSGKDNICIGSDFDGADTLKEISNVSEIGKLYEFLLKKNYSENLVNKIFFNNAKRFFDNFS